MFKEQKRRKKKLAEAHMFLKAASWEHKSRHIKYTAPVSPSLSQVERACDHKAEKTGKTMWKALRWEIKQIIRVSTTAPRSKHTGARSFSKQRYLQSLPHQWAAVTSN